MPLIKSIARIESITALENTEEAPESATALIGELQILIPLSGLINKEDEIARLQKEVAKLDGEISRANGKLSNQSFVDRAPEAVVNKERERLAEASAARDKLAYQLAQL